MQTPTRATSPTTELQSFLVFLGSMWGSLAGLSVVFPLSNTLTDVIPLAAISDDGALARISPTVVTAVSTISVLFTILWLFGSRHSVAQADRTTRLRRSSLISFVGGVLLIMAYLALYEVKLDRAHNSWGWESDDPAHLLVEVPLMAVYAGFFVLITRAFVLLGLIEYYGHVGTTGSADRARE